MPVEVITEELRHLAIDMIETMYSANGVGLAAPQIGRSEKLCVLLFVASKLSPISLVQRCATLLCVRARA